MLADAVWLFRRTVTVTPETGIAHVWDCDEVLLIRFAPVTYLIPLDDVHPSSVTRRAMQ